MNVSIKPILQDKITFLGFFFSILFTCIAIGYILVFFKMLPPYLPLYNKMPWGYDRLGNTYEIFIPIGIAVVFMFGNILTAAYVYPKIPLLARLMCFVSFFVAIFNCVFIIKIASLVL